MPGIITHNKVFADSILLLKQKKIRSPYAKSIEILLSSNEFRSAGLFGAIGPNIFDYLPINMTNYISGSGISKKLHTDYNQLFLNNMMIKVLSYKDKNNEWSSMQRAYLYGYISHLIADSIFHPFIYYWSGFSNSNDKKNLQFFREQHLLFEYNIDNYFNYYYNEEHFVINKFRFDINEMFPVKRKGGFFRLNKSIKNLLTGIVSESFSSLNAKTLLINGLKNDKANQYHIFDLIPYFIKFAYRVKRSNNDYLIRIIQKLKSINNLYSDYLIRYPNNKKINRHVLNLHKERWFHPTGAAGLHYESVVDLFKKSCEKTVDVWKKIETILYEKKETNLNDVVYDLLKNTSGDQYTGLPNAHYENMNISDTVRLRF